MVGHGYKWELGLAARGHLPMPPAPALPQVGMIGDLANGRTVRSLCMCLSMYKNVTVYFVAPEVVRMRDDIKVRVG